MLQSVISEGGRWTSISAIARDLGLPFPKVRNKVQRLAKIGVIEVVQDELDQRKRLVHVNDAEYVKELLRGSKEGD